jgi:hypothetical protein
VNLVGAIGMVAAGITFIVIQCVWVGSSPECSTLVTTSICASSSRITAFVFLIIFCAGIVVVEAASVYVIAKLWHNHIHGKNA